MKDKEMHYGMAYVDKHSLEQWISALQTVIAFLGSMHLSLVRRSNSRQADRMAMAG